MIPFARIFNYGNKTDPWYKDTLIAFDSTRIVGTSGWTDYNGIPLLKGNGGAATSTIENYPDSPFGTGLMMKSGGIYWNIGASTFPIANYIDNDWTIDYYTKQLDAYVYPAIVHLYPLAINTPFSAVAAASRILLAYSGGNQPGYVHLWNNSGAPVVYSSWPTTAYYGQGVWQHHAITYERSTGLLKFYVNEVYQGSVTRTLTSPGATTTASIRTPDNASFSAAIDRYRMRAGIHY
jgi:hypothetical protein